MHERNLSLAAKGKAKESVYWQLGWWDLSHSLEGTKRPAQWSKSSVIFTPHESEPRVLGRHFPSSRQFFLPTPPFPAMESYEPPTVLSMCPTDEWLFAYFPGNGNGGLGCVWRREAQLDNWTVKDCWSYPVGGGIVTAAWTCPHREWTVSDTGTSSRLPPIGPQASLANPILYLVTEAHILQAYAISPVGPSTEVGRASLLQPTDPAHRPADPDAAGKLGGDRICMKAAIGMSYQNPILIIAMRSQLLPSHSSTQAYQQAMDGHLGLPMDLNQPQTTENSATCEWELWGEEQTISLSVVRIDHRPGVPMLSQPLPPIYHTGSHLVDMVFYCPPPSSYKQASGGEKLDTKPSNAPTLYLATTFLDVDDYTTLPKSEIVCYTFLFNGPPTNAWVLRGETKRPSNAKVPCFLLPSLSRGGFVAGFLDTGGLLPRRKLKSRETTIGAIEVLKLPGLTAHEDWESVPIHSHVQAGSVDVPVSVAISPNETLVCCISSPLLGSHQSIQVLPRRVSGDTSLLLTSSLQTDLSRHLIAAILSRYSTSDVVHALAVPTLPTEVTVNTLHQAFTTMDANSFGLMEVWTAELLGVATEVYSARAQRLDRGPDRDICAARWQTAHEISSLAGCCGAFDTCREGDAYDLDAVWQLLSVTGWILEFVENLLKECIFVGERPDAVPATPSDSKTSGGASGTALDSPIFLHIVHPYSITRLLAAVEHVKRFHDQVAKLTPKGENSHIAKDFLMDITEGSGIDLALLGPLLSDVLQECKGLAAQDLRLSLASCSPVPALKPHVRKVVEKVLSSKSIDRARLFIKPSDLSDGLARLSLAEVGAGMGMVGPPGALAKDKNTDVVKKNTLWRGKPANVCVRCGGRSDVALERKVGAESPLSRWQTWEKSWQSRCVCGGLWLAGAYV